MTSKHSNFDPDQLAAAVRQVADPMQQMLQQFLDDPANAKLLKWDPLGVGKTFLDLSLALMQQPEKVLLAQKAAWDAYLRIWTDTAARVWGDTANDGTPTPAGSGAANGGKRGDRRFKHEAWENNPFFNLLKETYLVTADTVQSLVADAEHLDDRTARKAEFYTRLFVEAVSPSNFALTNPEVIEATVKSRGENLVQGLKNFLKDFDADKGELRIRMTDLEAFELGKNVALTPGKVIYQNRLMQLLQYSPSTETVFDKPLLIIPPWINKYYILDLQPKNSFIKWAVDQGHTVFVISWVNPDEQLAEVDFQDYIFEGAMEALKVMEQATGKKRFNVIGYCIGGTLLAAMLCYMKAKQDKRIASATFFTTMLDFSEPGDLGVFVDERQLSALEAQMDARGYHDGKRMAMTFNLLRSNDLIWSFFINNYLLGKAPFPFDLLYWNSDATRLPAKMHSTYLRTMYLENKLIQPGAFKLKDVGVDLREIETPSYFISAEEDHIAPWKSTYAGAQLFSGPVTFTLGKSGHIAGVVNPPAANKYGYYTSTAEHGSDFKGLDAEDWHEQTQEAEGSWWPHWQAWIQSFGGKRVPTRHPGDNDQPVLEDAPGSYVKVRYE